MSMFLGIDPGLSGAMALLCSRRGLLDVTNLPVRDNGRGGTMRREIDSMALRDTLSLWSRVHEMAIADVTAVIELPVAMRGASTALSQGDTFGVVRTVAEFWSSRVVRVAPVDWKKRFGLTKQPKSASVACARRLYGQKLPKVLRNDLAEAILIAHYGFTELA